MRAISNNEMENRVTARITDEARHVPWSCDACGSLCTDEQVTVQVVDGEFAGFHVCEQCIEAGEVAKVMRDRAQKMRGDADELDSLADRIKVPSYRDYVLAEIRRVHDKEAEQTADQSLAQRAGEMLHRRRMQTGKVQATVSDEDICRIYGATLFEARRELRRVEHGIEQARNLPMDSIGTGIPF